MAQLSSDSGGVAGIERGSGRHPLRDLSEKGVSLGVVLRDFHPSLIADRLYRYNTLPRTQLRCAGWATRDDIVARLGFSTGPLAGRMDAAGYRLSEDPATEKYWLHFSRRSGATSLFKVYVSPRLDGLPRAFAAAVDIAAAFGCPAFKVGATLAGVLRPDKLVLYANSAERQEALASELAWSLRDVEAQGTPFTAAVDDRALVSVAYDPPDGPSSWRQYVTDCMARALSSRRFSLPADAEVELRRALPRNGIDPRTWTPLGPAELR